MGTGEFSIMIRDTRFRLERKPKHMVLQALSGQDVTEQLDVYPRPDGIKVSVRDRKGATLTHVMELDDDGMASTTQVGSQTFLVDPTTEYVEAFGAEIRDAEGPSIPHILQFGKELNSDQQLRNALRIAAERSGGDTVLKLSPSCREICDAAGNPFAMELVGAAGAAALAAACVGCHLQESGL
ncbi:hypothetical protein [Catellatospora sp. IY07-71]|uniref:hypothetical protein n=1 Tax=Catellatospora sp. IY07-71 TaxID=2728827 RepID=UPI001BB43431|nr:hypothetical protein [Catellatospora sp. IY07-71]